MTNIEDIVVQCSICDLYVIRETKVTGRVWGVISQDELKGKEISHGYCPTCGEQEMTKIRQERQQRKYTPNYEIWKMTQTNKAIKIPHKCHDTDDEI